MTDKLIQQSSRHSVFTQRFAGHLANLFDPYLERIQRELKVLMVDIPESTQNMRRINQLTREFRRVSVDVYGEYNLDVLFPDLELFSTDESIWQVNSLDSVIESDSINLKTPAPAQVWAGVNTTPLVLPDANVVRMLDPFVKDWEAGQIKKVNDIIRTGFVTGRTNAQITQDIAGKNGYLDNQNRQSIKTMVRTATTHTSNLARQKTMEENDDIVIGYEWVSTLDNRTSSICRFLDGKVYKHTDKKKRYPPAHPNACLKGTMITTSAGQKAIEDIVVGDLVLTHNGRYKKVTTVMAREHDGLARDLIDSFGSGVSLTNEHPVLTLSKGWCEVGDIERGDNLFYNTEKLKRPNNSALPKITQSVLLDSHHIVTDTTEELISYGIFSNTRGMSSAVNLDNGTTDNKISNVLINRPLEFIRNTKTIKYINEYLFVPCRVILKNSSSSFRPLTKSFEAFTRVFVFHPFTGVTRAFSMPFRVNFRPVIFASRLWNKLGVSPNGIALASCFNAKLDTPLPDGVVRKSVLPFNKSKAFTFAPMIGLYNSFNKFICNFFHSKSASDKWLSVSVTSIVEYHYKGWVYNLSVEDDETYIANGFLVHNCRSSTAPVLDERFKIDDIRTTRASRGVEGGQQVAAESTYYGWLKSQGAQGKNGRAFVMDVLGKERGKLFLDGGLSAQKFKQLTTDELFQPIPLDELRKKTSLQLAFDKIG